MAIIEVNQLKKEYKQYKRFPGVIGALKTLFTQQYSIVPAVQDISFRIEAGEAVGYLGPNGAGKSTMIKMMTGILVPTSGDLRVRETIPHESRKQNAQKMGVVFGQRSQLWWELPAIDSFDVHRHIYKIPEDKYNANVTLFTELLQLESFLQTPVRQLSLGQRMRVEIAMALLHDPDLLFLDEPTIGLDVVAKDNIRHFLKTVNKEKKVTIILTTHDLKDIEEICPRMLIVDEGKLVYDGSVDELRSHVGETRKVSIQFANDPGHISITGASLLEDKGIRKEYAFQKETSNILDILSSLSEKYEVVDISMEDPDIEEVIRTLYRQLHEQKVALSGTEQHSDKGGKQV